MAQTRRPACRRCADERYAAVAAAVEQGVPPSAAATAAGIARLSVDRHRRSCPTFARRIERGLKRGKRALNRQGENTAASSAAAVSRAQPIIVAAIAAGANRAEAARAAGIPPATERSWHRRRPDYRAAVEQAQAAAQA